LFRTLRARNNALRIAIHLLLGAKRLTTSGCSRQALRQTSLPPALILIRSAFGTSSTGVERRRTSNSGQWQNSVCMSYTLTISRQGVRDAKKRPASIAVALAMLPRQPLLRAREVFPVVFFQKGAQL
jgi:hypothetical protein